MSHYAILEKQLRGPVELIEETNDLVEALDIYQSAKERGIECLLVQVLMDSEAEEAHENPDG